MPFPREDVLPIERAKPWIRIYSGKRQLVGHVDVLEGLVTFIFMKANPPAVRIQTAPGTPSTGIQRGETDRTDIPW